MNELTGLLDRLINSVQSSKKNVEINLNSYDKEKMVNAALGLTFAEAENVFAKAIVSQKRLDVRDISIIHSEKKQIIKKSGLLEFYPTPRKYVHCRGAFKSKTVVKKTFLIIYQKSS
jgi:hypothetical protein